MDEAGARRLCEAFRAIVIVRRADYSFIIAESAPILPVGG